MARASAPTASALGLALALLLGLACPPPAHAEAPPHLLTNMPPPGAVSTGCLLPTFPNKRFPAGKAIDVVLGLHNDGSETYNISLVAGSLNSPADFSLHVQNFSAIGYGYALGPGEEVSVAYRFVPDARLSPRDFVVALTAFYSDASGQWYSSTFFNQTVDIVESRKAVDWELLSLVALFLAALGGAGYGAYCWVVAQGWVKPMKKKAKRAAPVAAAPMTAADHDEWVKGTPYDAHRKRALRGGKQQQQ